MAMNNLKKIILGLLIVMGANLAVAQPTDEVKTHHEALVGMSYLHIQVTLILNHWDFHPLNNIPLDEIDGEFQEHMLEEMEHDEAWVDNLLVEEVFDSMDPPLEIETEEAINANLEFYEQVLGLLRDPEALSKKIKSLQEELEEAETRLYDIILPALAK